MQEKDWLEEYEVEAYVGRKAKKYLHNWEEHPSDKVKGINIVAFFFPAQWLGYRKIYAQLALSYLFMVLVYMLSLGLFMLYEYDILPFRILIYPFIGFLMSKLLLGIYFAAFGNGIYREKVLGSTHEFANLSDEDKYKESLKKKGKPNIIAPIIISLLEALLFVSSYISMYEALNYTVQFVS